MIKKDYVITIKGLQEYEDNDSTDVEMMAECDFAFEDGRYFIEYEETEATGLEGSTTTVEVAEDYLSLSREGTVDTTLLFIEGRQTTSYYETPYGTMILGITAESIESDFNESGGNARVKYNMSMNNMFSGTNTFEINVRKMR